MKAEQCRRNARRYLLRARQTNPELKAVMIELAAYWMRLAQRAEASPPQQIQPNEDKN